MAKATKRQASLREALTAYRREMEHEIRGRIRNGRSDGTNREPDSVDASDVNFQQAIAVSLLQMQAATLAHIDAALRRLDDGRYGFCFECSDPIAAARLRALPVAVRCRACEEQREQAHGRDRDAAQRAATPFSHVTG